METTKGAPPKFREAHINWVFWKIASNEPVGRKALVQETSIGEGSMRTILDRLTKYDLIGSSRKGHFLTKSGKKAYNNLTNLVKVGNLEMKSFGGDCFVIHIKNVSEKVDNGMVQRDASMKLADIGVTTLVYDSGLKMPGIGSTFSIDSEYEIESRILKNEFGMGEGDVLIIASDKKTHKREEAAWAAASTLLR